MLTICDQFPDFKLTGVINNDVDGFKEFTNKSSSGQWQIYFFWPKDFTFVCPTEIQSFGELYSQFQAKNCAVYGISTDSEFSHLAWRQNHPGLNNIPFPMLSDVRRELSVALGILHKQEGVCLRATYIVDPQGVIRHISINDLNVGRSTKEILRLLDGYQNGGLMQCNWQPGQQAITI